MQSNKKKYIIATALLLLTLLLRLPALYTPILDVDESQFAGYANALLDGGHPFISSVDTKPVGIYFFYSILFLIFGRNNMIAVHFITAIWVWVTALYCRRITRYIYTERAGWVAALFYIVFTTTYVPKFISTSITAVLMLPLTMSVYYIIKWEKFRSYTSILFSGILFGIACLFKYQAGINLILVGLFFLIFSPLVFKEDGRPVLRPFLYFLAGGLSVAIVFFAYLKYIGVWDAFYFWSIIGSAAYIGTGSSTSDFFMRFLARGGSFIASTALIWIFGIKEILSTIRHMRFDPKRDVKIYERALIAMWFIISIAPICTGGRFFGHYFIQLLPPLCILAAISSVQSYDLAMGNRRRRRIISALVIAGMLVPAVGFGIARIHASDIYKAIGEDDPEEYRPLGEYVKGHTKAKDPIFVWGFATPIYFFADRPAASRFLWSDWLTGRIPGSPTVKDSSFDTRPFITNGSWDMLFVDFKKNPPVYIIDTSPGNYHDYGKYPIERYTPLLNYINEHYFLEAKYRGANFYRRTER